MERAFGSDETDNAAVEAQLNLAGAIASARLAAAAQVGRIKRYVRASDWHKVPEEDRHQYEVVRGICPTSSVCIGSLIVVAKAFAKKKTVFVAAYFGEVPEGAFKLMYDEDQVRISRMMGKNVGESVRLDLGDGIKDYKIQSIENR
jgi:hypothetical protein